ncbi:MAG: hypothetical protein ACREUY_09725 [Burkholderiales bacterium]
MSPPWERHCHGQNGQTPPEKNEPENSQTRVVGPRVLPAWVVIDEDHTPQKLFDSETAAQVYAFKLNEYQLPGYPFDVELFAARPIATPEELVKCAPLLHAMLQRSSPTSRELRARETPHARN